MVKLVTHDVFQIKSLVVEKRGQLSVGMGPIGDNIFKLARKLNIKMVFLPIINSSNSSNSFSALYLKSKESTKEIVFIGLNTFQTYDRQIFSIAHELYHHWTDTTLSVCHMDDERSQLVELKANRFAAEFLLPTETLLQEIGNKTCGERNLYDSTYLGLLRFIALLHCDYRLPYTAIVRRLFEEDAITVEQFDKLKQEKPRNEDSTYYKVGLSQNKVIFENLNKRTKNMGVDGENLDMMIGFLEENMITLEELSGDLSLFGKSLSDFELEETVDQEDLKELAELFEGMEEHEA
ncbi:ImmA/IrrE family metallo-endopeptidase [Bacillus sp. SM2101]|uniref:ImmA/IrrE family metallo-endopeptidase n=1 Tax=Bacillus sp. SM2101 TaxID=2805366 RepID=UPI001BDE14D2|nr:ImmA/IrrE family metallo-endopeptidase [Bacillus sp. SM2101]